MGRAPLRVAVVGAGVIGLSIARSLARLGASVSVFERRFIGAGTSGTTFAWVNANGKKPESYHALNLAGMREHEALQASAPAQACWLDRTGTYEWATAPVRAQALAARVAALRGLDYPVEELSRAHALARFPELRLPGTQESVWHFPTEAVAHTAPLMAWLWSDAAAHGAVLHEGVDVLGVSEIAGHVTLERSDGTRWTGDQVVLAVGRWTAQLTAMLGTTLAMVNAERRDERACGFLAVTNPVCIQMRSNLVTPELNLRPEGGGRLRLQATDLDHAADPAAPAPADGAVGDEMLGRLRRLFANTAGARIERMDVGQRSRPADGLPALGYLPRSSRTYVACTHSGITLAPIIGRLVADELVHGHRDPLLQPYGPARLINRHVADFAPVASTHFPAGQSFE